MSVKAAVHQVNKRIDNVVERLSILENLEKKLALAVVELLPAHKLEVPGYEFTKTNGGWVWKHFLRGSRSPTKYLSLVAATKAARLDSLEHLAYPKVDLAAIIKEHQRAKRSGNGVRQTSPEIAETA